MGQGVSDKDIWRELQRPDSFLRTNIIIRPECQKYLGHLGQLFADLLAQPVTLERVLQAKQRYLGFLLERGFVQDCASHFPAHQRQAVATQLEGLLRQCRQQYGTLAADLEKGLKSVGLTADQVMLSQKVGLSPANARQYRLGQLTFAGLLGTQPEVIVNMAQ